MGRKNSSSSRNGSNFHVASFAVVLVMVSLPVLAQSAAASRQHQLTQRLLSNLEALEAALMRREAARIGSGQLAKEEEDTLRAKNSGENENEQQFNSFEMGGQEGGSFDQLELTRRAQEDYMPTSNLDSDEEARVQRINQMIAGVEGRPFDVDKRASVLDDGDGGDATLADDDYDYENDDLGRLARLRELRRELGKRNYNLDHLARMNFRRSFRASSALNNRHILGGLKKRSSFNDRHILGGLKRKRAASARFNDRHILAGLKRRAGLNSRHILGGL